MSLIPDLNAPVTVPKDYSAAYVEELVNQHAWAMEQIQTNLNLAQHVLDKIRVQIAPH